MRSIRRPGLPANRSLSPPKELLGARPSRPQKSRRDSGAPGSSLGGLASIAFHTQGSRASLRSALPPWAALPRAFSAYLPERSISSTFGGSAPRLQRGAGMRVKRSNPAEIAMQNSPGCVRAGAAYGEIVPIAGVVSAAGARQCSPGCRMRSIRRPGLPANRSLSPDRAVQSVSPFQGFHP